MNKYTQTYFITNDNMDINYRLTPIGAVMFFQDCFAQYMTTKHVAAFDVISKNLFWVVAELNIEFTDDMPFWSEKIDVEVWISEASKIKIYADFELIHNGKVFAKGNSCWFILSTETHRPMPVNIVADKFGVLNKLTLGEHKKFKLDEPDNVVRTITHKTNLSDIDFNNHVNNKSYINVANATLDRDFKLTHNLKTMSVKFIKESFIDEILTCTTYSTKENYKFIHKIKHNDDDICDITTIWEPISEQNDISNFKLQIRE